MLGKHGNLVKDRNYLQTCIQSRLMEELEHRTEQNRMNEIGLFDVPTGSEHGDHDSAIPDLNVIYLLMINVFNHIFFTDFIVL